MSILPVTLDVQLLSWTTSRSDIQKRRRRYSATDNQHSGGDFGVNKLDIRKNFLDATTLSRTVTEKD